jgi:hypothetical protein
MKFISAFIKFILGAWIWICLIFKVYYAYSEYKIGGFSGFTWAFSPFNYINIFHIILFMIPIWILIKVSEFIDKYKSKNDVKVESIASKIIIESNQPSIESLANESDNKLNGAINIATNPTPFVSEQDMRPGYILFVSSNQFPMGLKMISSKLNASEHLSKHQNLVGSYRIQNEIEIKTGNTDLMFYDLDCILSKHRYSKESYCYTIPKIELKDLLMTKKIQFQYFDKI